MPRGSKSLWGRSERVRVFHVRALGIPRGVVFLEVRCFFWVAGKVGLSGFDVFVRGA